SIDPGVPLGNADIQIIQAVLGGSKELDNRRNRILLAGCDYPGSVSSLDYCVFDTRTRHLLGLVKKFKIDPANIRLLRNEEYTKANLVKHIDWVFDDVQPGDLRGIFLSSHGSVDTGADGSVEGLIVTWE